MALLTVAPTILTNDPDNYKALVEAYHSFTKRAHIDVSDGTLSESLTIPAEAVWWPKDWTTDVHLMSAQPSVHVPALLKLMPSLVILHSEATEDLAPIFAHLQKNGIKVGIAIMPPVYPGLVRKLIELADHILIFSGNLGENDGTADLLQLEKVRIIKKIKPAIEIGWDGGVKLENIRTIAQAGVNIINAGSAIATSPNPAKAYADLVAEAEQLGAI